MTDQNIVIRCSVLQKLGVMLKLSKGQRNRFTSGVGVSVVKKLPLILKSDIAKNHGNAIFEQWFERDSKIRWELTYCTRGIYQRLKRAANK